MSNFRNIFWFFFVITTHNQINSETDQCIYSNVETCSRGNNRNFSLVKHVAPGTRILWKGIALCCSNAVHCTLNLIKRILCFLRLIHVVHALNKFAAFVLMINTVPFVHSRLQNVFYAVSREREREMLRNV